MKITRKDIERVAQLARLSFNEQEKEDLMIKMNAIVAYMEKLNELDVDQVEPTYHIFPLTNVFREDRAGVSMEREKVLMNAPDQQDGYFKVPKMLE